MINIFQYYSDIYYNLNFTNNTETYIEITPVKKGDNIINNLILAGNIGKPTSKRYWKFLEKVSKNFHNIFLVSGQVEYEGCNNSYIDSLIRSYINNFRLHNIYYLSDTFFLLNGIKIVGGKRYNDIIENELSDTRFKRILITSDPYIDISKNNYSYWIYGNTLKNIKINNKILTNQFGKNWSFPLSNFQHDANFVI